jgi:hypothetical protein
MFNNSGSHPPHTMYLYTLIKLYSVGYRTKLYPGKSFQSPSLTFSSLTSMYEWATEQYRYYTSGVEISLTLLYIQYVSTPINTLGTQGGEQVRVFVGWVVFTETHRPVYYIFHLRMVFPPYDILCYFSLLANFESSRSLLCPTHVRSFTCFFPSFSFL